jgi:hypothetical protein
MQIVGAIPHNLNRNVQKLINKIQQLAMSTGGFPISLSAKSICAFLFPTYFLGLQETFDLTVLRMRRVGHVYEK